MFKGLPHIAKSFADLRVPQDKEEGEAAAARVSSALGLGIQGGMKGKSSIQSSFTIIYALN